MTTLTVQLAKRGRHLHSQKHLLDELAEVADTPTVYEKVIFDFSGVEIVGRRLVKAAIREARTLTIRRGAEYGEIELRGLSEGTAPIARLVFRAYMHDVAVDDAGACFSMPLFLRGRDVRKLALREEIVRRDGEGCVWCGAPLSANQLEATLDHVLPQKQGGRWELDNLVLACGPCNCARGSQSAERWLRRCKGRGQAVKLAAVLSAIERTRSAEARLAA